MTKRKPKTDPDMFGAVEDAGWDGDSATQPIQRNGVNRVSMTLNPMDMVAKPKAQVANIRSDATPMGDDYS